MKRFLILFAAMSAVCSMVSAAGNVVGETSVISADTKSSASVMKKRFSWGIDAGSAIDMTGNDMSALAISACLGYSGPYVRFAGIGAGIDMMVSSSSSSYPVYAVFRTDFRTTPQLCFLDLRGGVAFNNIESYPMQTTPFGAVGLGVTLAKGRTFSSHIIISYNYIKLDDVRLVEDQEPIHIHDLQYASIGIGVTF